MDPVTTPDATNPGATPAEDEAAMADKFTEVVAMIVTNDLTFDFISENEEES